MLLIADLATPRLQQISMEGVPATPVSVSEPAIAVSVNPIGAALPSSGTLIVGPRTIRNLQLEATEDAPADQADQMRLRNPVGLFPFGKGWLVTDNEYGAVLYVGAGKAEVLAGYCTTLGPVHGMHDGSGRICNFSSLGGIVYDGKRFAYVADIGNNCIRRLDLSEVTQH